MVLQFSIAIITTPFVTPFNTALASVVIKRHQIHRLANLRNQNVLQ